MWMKRMKLGGAITLKQRIAGMPKGSCIFAIAKMQLRYTAPLSEKETKSSARDSNSYNIFNP
jgi:hypothetical protein